MPNKGKRIQEQRAKVVSTNRYSLDEGINLVKETGTAKFDESVEIAVRLGVNPRQADQMVRGTCSLPFGTGKPVRVLVFAQGDAARAAEEAGADFVGADDLVKKIQEEGWLEFDKAVAVRNMMPKIGRIGRVLGPRGLMPNAKSGTVVGAEDVGRVVREVKGGRIDFRVERAGIIHSAIGKVSMPSEQIRLNVLSLVQTLVRLKPSTAKGTYVRGIALSSTMGPGIRLDTHEVLRLSAELR